MQSIVFDGRIMPNSDKAKNNFVYFAGSDSKKSLMAFRVSTRRPFAKKGDDGYYPSDIIPVKAFGPTADFIHEHFEGGDPIMVTGYFAYDIGGVKDDGTKYPDRLGIIATNVEFCLGSGKKKDDGDAMVKSFASTPAPATSTAKRNPLNPF